jgi:hypothetical protein
MVGATGSDFVSESCTFHKIYCLLDRNPLDPKLFGFSIRQF